MGVYYWQSKIVRYIFILVVVGVSFFGSFYTNVILHEAGHFITAKHYNLEPKINIQGTPELFFSFSNEPLASTSFNNPNNKYVELLVTLMGPVTNLIMFFLGLAIFLLIDKKRKITQIALIVFMYIGLFSFLYNVAFFVNFSDGYYIMQLLH